MSFKEVPYIYPIEFECLIIKLAVNDGKEKITTGER